MIKNIKKLSLLVLTCFAFLIFSSTAFALPEKKEEIVFEVEPITDVNKLFERAKKGESDLIKEKIKPQSVLINLVTNEEVKLKTFITTQKIKKVKSRDNMETDYYMTTVFAVSSWDDLNYEQAWDSTGGVRGYATVYWKEPYYQGFKQWQITKADGGWNINDSTLTCTNRKVFIAENGWSDKLQNNYYQEYPYANVGFTFNYTPFFEPIRAADLNAASVRTEATISRGSSSWLLRVVALCEQ